MRFFIRFFRQALMKSAGQTGERAFCPLQLQNHRNALCISRFWGKTGGKDAAGMRLTIESAVP